MHPGQLTITTQMVIKLVAAQFPEWVGRPVTVVVSHGTVNALFRIGVDLVARLPLLAEDPEDRRRALEQEADGARRLRRISPVPTPEPIAIAEPGHGYPSPWSVYRWLPGVIAGDHDGIADSSRFAEDLAGFIIALRNEPTEGRVFTGSGRGGRLCDHDEGVADHLEHSDSMIDVRALERIWSQSRDTRRAEPDTWTHGDLMPGNLLVDGQRLSGIIDVGQFGVADPALDLQPAWNLFRPRTRAIFRSALGSDDDEWARGKGWALAQAIGCLWYYRDTNPVMSHTAQITLEALIRDDEQLGSRH